MEVHNASMIFRIIQNLKAYAIYEMRIKTKREASNMWRKTIKSSHQY